jgi:hypothetical protein
VLEVRQNVLGKRFDSGTPREQGLRSPSATAGRTNVRVKFCPNAPRFVHQVAYIPLVGESFDKGVRVRGIDQMAERIVESMETDW